MSGLFEQEENYGLEIGKVYEVEHARKGTFEIRVSRVERGWVAGEVVKGYADAIRPEHRVHVGESFMFNGRLAKFIEVREARPDGGPDF